MLATEAVRRRSDGSIDMDVYTQRGLRLRRLAVRSLRRAAGRRARHVLRLIADRLRPDWRPAAPRGTAMRLAVARIGARDHCD
jgi:hypothetical protein